MSWKSFACVAALSALITSPALAMPSLSWVDNTGSATLQLTPSGTGSVAVEIQVDYDGGMLSNAVVGSDFDTANPGNNPITAGQTTGLYDTDEALGDYFLSYGSVVFGSATAVDLLTFDYAGSGDVTLPSIVVAEGGLLVTVTDPGPFALGGVTLLPGDFNGDGSVNGLDLNILSDNFGTGSGATLGTGDANGDGAVNGLDLNIVSDNFGTSLPAAAAAVPEPTSIALIALGGIAACFPARKRS